MRYPTKSLHPYGAAFTLLELIVVIAGLGILASLAISNFL
jgi:prepilin-type N-terminal cleavage/methylation domain-containing protein